MTPLHRPAGLGFLSLEDKSWQEGWCLPKGAVTSTASLLPWAWSLQECTRLQAKLLLHAELWSTWLYLLNSRDNTKALALLAWGVGS